MNNKTEALSKAWKMIETLKSLGIDVQLYEKKLNKIERGYSSVTCDIEEITKDLEKTEVYIRIASFGGALRALIKSENKDLAKIDEMRKTLLNHLSYLKMSESLPQDNENQVVEDMYNLALEFIKEEIRTVGTSKTLEILKNDFEYSINLNRCIIKRLENINLKDARYAKLASIKESIDSQGHDIYLNETLLKAMIETDMPVIINDGEDKKIVLAPAEGKDSRAADLTLIIEKYLDELISLNDAKKHYEEDKKSNKITHNNLIKELFVKASGFCLSASIALGLFGGIGYSLTVGNPNFKKDGKYYFELDQIPCLFFGELVAFGVPAGILFMLSDGYIIFGQLAVINEIIEDIKNGKRNKEELEKELKRLEELIKFVIEENKDKIEELKKLLPLIENNPNYQKAAMEAQAVLQRVKQTEIEIKL